MMETLAIVGGLLGILALVAGIVMLVVNVVRRRRLKKWALTAGAGFLLFMVMAVINPSSLEPQEDGGADDAAEAALVPPTPQPRSDFVEFGIDKDPASEVLGLLGVSETFNQDTDLWLRVRLTNLAGKVRVEYFLQQQLEGPGWSPLNSWVNNIDPDSNIFRLFEPTLQRLDPGDYKVFVVIREEKRAEGFFTIKPAPALAEATLEPEIPSTVTSSAQEDSNTLGTSARPQESALTSTPTLSLSRTAGLPPTTAAAPIPESTEVTLSRDSCTLFVIAATAIEPRGVEAMKYVADKYAPGMTLELVVWFSERLETIPTTNVDIVNFAKMLALVREGAIPSIEAGDYYTLRNKFNSLGSSDPDTLARTLIGDGIILDERFSKIDTTNIQIQIDKQKEQGIADCATLGTLPPAGVANNIEPMSVTVPLSLAGFASGKCDRAIQFYSDRMEILTETFPGNDGERQASVTLRFKGPKQDTYEPRLIAELQKAGESIAERCAR